MSAEQYQKRGVSPTKEDVHKAISGQDKGLFPGAFCKIVEDPAGDPAFCSVMHADGAGTKSALAYIRYRETGDANAFGGTAQDSIVMNVDDLLCVGALGGFVVSNTIGRNAHRVGGDAVKALIEGYAAFAESMAGHGISMFPAGGETADVGDLVNTVIVDSTVFVRLRRDRVVDCADIRAGDAIVGLSSTGRAVYEKAENSGIGSNGLTAARHLMLSKYYAEKYPETFSATLDMADVYCGRFRMEDVLPGSSMTVGDALLSPTRTYAPIVKDVLENAFGEVHGIVHCTGGGQKKCVSFGSGLHYVKDNPFPVPPLFAAIRESGNMELDEMYQIFNMGHRMEIYCDPQAADAIAAISQKYGVEARVVGRVEKSRDGKNAVTIG